MFDVELPIIQAPMAGGPDTAALAAAVTNAGGMGSLGCAYLAPEQIEAAAAAVRAHTQGPFALNLFVRADAPDDPVAEARVASVLARFRGELGLAAPGPSTSTPRFEEQLEAVLRCAPRVFSFTFGVPAPEQIAAVRAHGIAIVGTATTVEEARALADAGVDAICAQGAEAGGHRGTFLGAFEDGLVGTIALVPQIVRATRLPVIAAGGIMTGQGIRAALSLGATAVQLGTAFLCCPEAGTSAPHRGALATATATTITRAFSGRPARGIRNRMTDAFAATEPAPFPQQQRLTAELRREATRQGRTDLMQLWAGQGAPHVRTLPASELVAVLAREAGLRA
ncbi:MAG: nitronate monooxygenase [Deltaproteobacteria bacterium]|nr:nitronate monooxygenase [Deltaproteobacteria bacterium]